MGKNKKSETLISYRNRIGDKKKVKREDGASAIGNGNGEGRGGGEGKGRFYGCYLLTSLNPRNKGHTYIGFTVNPRRRIRQHNGETQCGARKTKSKRPWEMVLCIYGFPTNVAALQFEWAWQHPIESLAVRNAAVNFKSLSGIANKIKLAFTMLNLPAWQSLNLKVNFFSTKYTKHLAGCPNLPDHMKVKVCPMEDLPCYTEGDWSVYENDVWADEEECYETFGRQQSVKEGLQDTLLSDKKSSGEESCRTSGSQENSMEGVEGMEICDFNGCQNDIEGKESKEDTRRLCDLNMQKETYQPSFCLNESLPGKMCSLGTSFRDIAETIQDTNMLGPIKECNFKLDQMTSVQSQTPSVKGPIAPGEVEVIDVFTPSPGHTVGSGSKKRRVSTLCPEIIDLTMSPIFV